MKAVVIREHGSYDKLLLEERAAPEPREGEVRVRIRAAALNHLDTWVRRGIPGFKFPLPIIPGCDGAGVTDAGEEVVLAPGLGHPLDKDYGILGETRDGTCAEFIVVPRENVLPKPGRLSWEEAAAWPLTFLTAWAMLTRRAQVQIGEWVLVHAAGSGVGVACVQMAKMLGARVIGTASSEAKRRRVLDLGADAAIPYEDFARAARGIAGKAGVDVVVDHVGPATWEGSVSVLRRGGRLVTCGGTTGHEIKFDLRHLFFKSLSFLGSTMGTPEELRTVLGHVEAGRLKPVVDSVFKLDEIRKAHERLADRAVFGKVVVVP
ncbi:MAG TPA: zinc-binding dehydrogenase [Candidatus Eisenbacteria bacterium]|nr:zinc-binding dehydrogenase [Candidatus Eisenbacteria bacterium]